MNYKLLALDLDGTLFTSRGYIAEQSKARIGEAQKQGIMVTLATGRHYPFAKSVARELMIDVPLITHDGGYIAHPQSDEIYFVKRIPYQTVLRIIRLLRPLQIRIMILHEFEALTNQRFGWRELFARLGQIASLKYYLWERYSYQYMPDHEMLAYISSKGLSPPKIFIMGEEGRMKRAKERLEKHFATEIRLTTSGYGIEILPPGISKGFALQVLGEKLGVDREQIIAAGDNYNDLEMLQYAGLGVAMGNAPEAIREQVDFVTHNNDQDGIAHLIERFILGRGLVSS